jgi:hypothetical protein
MRRILQYCCRCSYESPLNSPQRIRHQDKTSDRAVTSMQIAKFHPASGI